MFQRTLPVNIPIKTDFILKERFFKILEIAVV